MIAAESAFLKSIRLKYPDETLYWLEVLLNLGASTPYLAKRVFLASCRDNLDLGLISEASRLLYNPDPVELRDIAFRLALTEKLWSVPQGRAIVKLAVEAEKSMDYRAMSDEELQTDLALAFDSDSHLNQTLLMIGEVCRRKLYFGERQPSYLRLYNLLVERARGTDLEFTARLLSERRPVLGEIPEQAITYVLSSFLIGGPFSQGIQYDRGIFIQACENARAKLADGNRPAPSWALDGGRCGGDDKRFSGTWHGYLNMSLMFERYGRVSPEDEGVLFRTRDGWKPVIEERADGSFQVQSEQNPEVFFTVAVAALERLGMDATTCTCPHHQVRKRRCCHMECVDAHLAHRGDFYNEELPVTVVA